MSESEGLLGDFKKIDKAMALRRREVDSKKLIDAIERVAKQAARHDFNEEIVAGEAHAKFFKKYYDLHMEYMGDTKVLNDDAE